MKVAHSSGAQNALALPLNEMSPEVSIQSCGSTPPKRRVIVGGAIGNGIEVGVIVKIRASEK